MSDQIDGKPISFTGNGQGQNSPEGAGQSDNRQPDVFTRSEFEAEWERRSKELEKNILSQSQSYADKGTHKVRAKLAEVEATVKRTQAAGVELSPEQIEKMRQDAITEAYADESDLSPAGAQVAQVSAQDPAKPQPQEALDPVNQIALQMQQKAGVMLYDNDPEVVAIKAAEDEVAFLEAVRQGIAAKQQRMSRSPEARIPGLVNGRSTGGNLMAQYQAELKQIPRGNVDAVAKLKAKYIGMGLKEIF